MTKPRQPAIMFSIAQNVPAIIERRKTQTRRLADKPPRYRVGDECWIRETWAPIDDAIDGITREDPVCIGYKSDLSGLRWECDRDDPTDGPQELDVSMINWDRVKWRTPIFFPRFASRASIGMLEVRTEQLHLLTDEDAAAEGMRGDTPRGAFAALWDGHYGDGAWACNPLVHVYKFEVIRCAV